MKNALNHFEIPLSCASAIGPEGHIALLLDGEANTVGFNDPT